MSFDPRSVIDTFEVNGRTVSCYSLKKLQSAGIGDVMGLPYCLRVILESVIRNCDGFAITENDVRSLANWDARSPAKVEIPFKPARVVLQDLTGVPAVVDLAALRSAMHRIGGDPNKINPLVPVDLVIDHSIQVDLFGSEAALQQNIELEFRRNRERYEFLRWGQKAFDGFQVVPPNVGIVHQVNLEWLAKGAFLHDSKQGPVAIPDTLVGTDSHTTMINGLGVVGWGVGGIEAEAVMLGQPVYMLLPEVVGFELSGKLTAGATATDMVLTVTEILRNEGVVGKFVEFIGDGVSQMTLADRATIANMAPEYGATMGFFPTDAESVNYLRQTGRTEEEVALLETFAQTAGIFHDQGTQTPRYTKLLKLDLESVEASLAGPRRPQDRVILGAMKGTFANTLRKPVSQRGFGLDEQQLKSSAPVEHSSGSHKITHGAIVIAAITSCTNTSNPSVMLAAGLLAKNAAGRGLKVQPHVKTSLAPGSRVVSDYLDRAGLSEHLNKLGFHTVGYGCTTCIGNSGPLPEAVSTAVEKGDLVTAAVLSGNRNFEGRVNPLVKANYLASPPLVVAYALAGTVDTDLTKEPIGQDSEGQDVFLSEIWPSDDEIEAAISSAIEPAMFTKRYESASSSNEMWNAIPVGEGDLYQWDESSTYIQEPPFLKDMTVDVGTVEPVQGARVLALLGDSVTTDHISPAGGFAKDSPAGRFLIERGVQPCDFNTYGTRRGNDLVMIRGTLANIRIRNQLAPGTEGGWTRHLPDGEEMSIYDAAMRYQKDNVPLVILAGKEYGTGSSRDWAAKGTRLLGVRAVIAESFERIHRSNLIGMGVLPLEFGDGQNWKSLGLTGEETFDIPIGQNFEPRSELRVTANRPAGNTLSFPVNIRIDSPMEVEYYKNGGILPCVLRKLYHS